MDVVNISYIFRMLVFSITLITTLFWRNDMLILFVLIVVVIFVLLHELIHAWKGINAYKDEKSLLLLKEQIEQIKRDLSFRR